MKEPSPDEAPAESALIENRRRNLEEIRRLVGDVYPFRYPLTAAVSEIARAHRERPGEQLEREPVLVATAGRILARRTQGKAGFLDLSDGLERLQAYVRRDVVGETGWEVYRALDLGDWIGVSGGLFRTRTGELTVKAQALTFLAKCLRPLPEKWHGLKDVERRYRQRYLDLAVNPEARSVFELRSRIVRYLRRFLDAREYLEVETPMMQA
ncbi:MAG TPA: OB-fold nucleic acid binding domain-containing protein, partial [Thermoanaerobaculia bacterium]|nr:OB-fold nucleic acid binding domain-containing protein [Thermoanaerobaculia bacterium]